MDVGPGLYWVPSPGVCKFAFNDTSPSVRYLYVYDTTNLC